MTTRMNRPPSNCPECSVLLDREIEAWERNPNWEISNPDVPEYPWGVLSRLLTRTQGTDLDEQGICLVACPDCNHHFSYQAWEPHDIFSSSSTQTTRVRNVHPESNPPV